jgi:hypothetical protein
MKNKELKDFIHNNVYQNTSTGYVLTPSELAFEIIQTLPKSIFKSESTTFLDPICKSGTFLFEIIEELYENGHTIKNIEGRIFTIDSNSHSLNVANSSIGKILNKLSGSFKIDYKSEFTERYYNRLISSISKGKYTTFDDFLSMIMVDKTNKEFMKELQKTISEFIVQYEKVSKLESKLFGEVFTPRKLIDEMLDTLPEDVWKNKDLKWLDPAVGIGNFPSAILDRLMIGLSDEFKDELERKKHILEEMLYFCDISIKNLFLLYKLFDCNNEFKLNVYRGSFLTEDFDKYMKEFWKLDSFDVIIGNPPYQSSEATGDNKLYLDFSKKSLIFLKKSGNLLFITPKNIMDYILQCDKNRSYFDDFYQIEYLVVDTPAKYFKGVGSTFLYFNLKKEKYNKKTKIKCYNSNKEEVECEIFLEKGQSIPNIVSDLNLSIISKIRDKKDKFKFEKMTINSNNRNKEFRIRKKQFDDGKVSKLKGDNYKYPVIDGINKNNPFPGKVFYMENDYSDKKPKLIINGSGYLCPSFDKNGDYFLSDNMTYIHINNEDEFNNLKIILESKIANYWLNQFRLNGFSDAKNIIILPYIPYNNKLSNYDIYQYFNLTQEEIDLIENTIK